MLCAMRRRPSRSSNRARILLDTNILSYWFDEARAEHQIVVRHLSTLDADAVGNFSGFVGGDRIWPSLRFRHGHGHSGCVQGFCEQTTSKCPAYSSEYIALLWANPGAALREVCTQNGKRSLRPCQLADPVTATSLGIQENDLWIAAQAIEFNLVLVTHDRLNRLKEVAANLLEFEDWAASTIA